MSNLDVLAQACRIAATTTPCATQSPLRSDEERKPARKIVQAVRVQSFYVRMSVSADLELVYTSAEDAIFRIVRDQTGKPCFWQASTLKHPICAYRHADGTFVTLVCNAPNIDGIKVRLRINYSLCITPANK